MKQQLAIIIKTIKAAKGNDQLTLAKPITVRTSPHTYPIEIHGLQASPQDQLIIMTVDLIGGFTEPSWRLFTETQQNADMIIASIYQRLLIIYKIREVAA
jgi:hypothetical protein